MTILTLARRNIYPIILLLVFMIAHGIFYFFGGRFDAVTLNFWQIVDRELLRERFLESLWYLHIQPPLFNAFLGFVQFIPGIDSYWIYYLSYIILGIAAALSLFQILRNFRIAPGVALGIVSLCVISPSWILYEHWLFYEFPTMALLTIAIYRLQRLLQKPTAFNSFFAFSVLMLLFLLRSIFHWFWYALAFSMILFAVRSNYKSIIKGALLPTGIIVLFVLKNYLLFGVWTTSTWMGPNLLMMNKHIPFSVRDQLYVEGKFSPVVAVGPFAPLEDFEKWVPGISKQKWGVPILDLPRRTDGSVNYNHCAYIAINQYQLNDIKAMIVRDPWGYLKQVQESWRRFCYPCWINLFFYGQPKTLDAWLGVWNRIFLGWNQEEMLKNYDEIQITPQKRILYWMLPLLLAFAFLLLVLPSRLSHLDSNDRFLLAFCFFTTFLIIFAGTFLLSAENNRVRFLITPLLAVDVALILDRLGKGFLQIYAVRKNKENNE